MQQAQVTQLLYERRQNVVYIAPTGELDCVVYSTKAYLNAGSGKTMPNTLCSKYFDERRSTIWLLPLLALHEQHHYTSRRFGIASESWSVHTSSNNPPSNVLATIDQATYESFKNFTAQLIQQDLLARINIDEAHLILTHSSFRPVMQLLQWIASSAVQIVLTTATLPPSLEPRLLAAIGITSSMTLRAMTPRPNVSFNVVRADSSLEDAVQVEFRKALAYSSDNRVLLFCLTKREVEDYARTLDIPHCHSEFDTAEIALIIDRFRNDDRFRGLVASSILGVGLDVPNVSHVIHASFPRDVISFIQEAGRAGRGLSLSPSFSIVVLPPLLPLPVYPSDDVFGAQILRESILDQRSCRRTAIQDFLDGTSETCAMLSGSTHLCDNCTREAQSPPKIITAGKESICVSLTN